MARPASDPVIGTGNAGGEAGSSALAAHRQALTATHEWFDRHSGWAPPDEGTMVEWLADGVCRCPDECQVAPDGCCDHGLASWAIVLAALAEEDRVAARRRASFEARRLDLPPG